MSDYPKGKIVADEKREDRGRCRRGKIAKEPSDRVVCVCVFEPGQACGVDQEETEVNVFKVLQRPLDVVFV